MEDYGPEDKRSKTDKKFGTWRHEGKAFTNQVMDIMIPPELPDENVPEAIRHACLSGITEVFTLIRDTTDKEIIGLLGNHGDRVHFKITRRVYVEPKVVSDYD